MVLDAIRTSDGVQVVLKIVEMASTEEAIDAFLTNEPGAEQYTLPLLEVIPMYYTPAWGFLALPRMRQCSHPPFFAIVRELTEFVEQVLEVRNVQPACFLYYYEPTNTNAC